MSCLIRVSCLPGRVRPLGCSNSVSYDGDSGPQSLCLTSRRHGAGGVRQVGGPQGTLQTPKAWVGFPGWQHPARAVHRLLPLADFNPYSFPVVSVTASTVFCDPPPGNKCTPEGFGGHPPNLRMVLGGTAVLGTDSSNFVGSKLLAKLQKRRALPSPLL